MKAASKEEKEPEKSQPKKSKSRRTIIAHSGQQKSRPQTSKPLVMDTFSMQHLAKQMAHYPGVPPPDEQ